MTKTEGLSLEHEADAEFEVGTMAVRRVVTLVLVHHAVVIAHGDLQGGNLEAHAAAQIDVHPVEVLVVVVVVGPAAAGGADAAVVLHRGSQAVLEGRATEQENLGVTGEIVAIVQIDGNVDGVLHEGAGTGDVHTEDGGGVAALGGEHGIIDTGRDAEAAGERNVERDTGEGAVRIVRGVSSLQRGIEIARIDGHLGEGLGAEQHQGCGQNDGKNLFHTLFY